MADVSSAEALRKALQAIKDPASGRDIVSAGLVEGIEVRGGLVQVALLTDRAHAAAMEPVRREAEALLARQPGVTNATAVLTAHKARRPPRLGGARSYPRPREGAEGAAAAAAGQGDRRGGLGQGRRRQIHRRGQSGGGAGAAGVTRSACSTPTSMAPSLPRMLGADSRKPEVREATR